MNIQEMEQRIVRYGELRPCKTAFIDAHTPGSDQKENFTIIGAGVSESPDQYVHIRETPGFNIGAAGQPPRVRNSLHTHSTAEVFIVKSGRWRFFWGRFGDTGEVVLEQGDIINIPTGMFRGFENIGTEYGMLLAVLGGDDAGGGVVWAPQVIEEATAHGLILGDNGRLYDSKKGEQLPSGVQPMPVLDDDSIAELIEPSSGDVATRFVARYWDMVALSDKQPADVLSADGMLKDKPGFTLDLLTRSSLHEQSYNCKQHEILMVVNGHWRLGWDEGDVVLAPGDTCAVPPGMRRELAPNMAGEAALVRVRNTDDPAGSTCWV